MTTDLSIWSQPSDSRSDAYFGTVEPSEPSYGVGLAIRTSPMHPTDAVTAVGDLWLDFDRLLDPFFDQANVGGQYMAGSPDFGALFSDQSPVAASYAQLAASAGVWQFSDIQGGSSSDIPFNPPAGNQNGQLPAQHFMVPQTIHFTPTTPSRAPQLQSGHPQYASRSQVLGPSNLSTLPKVSESSWQPAATSRKSARFNICAPS